MARRTGLLGLGSNVGDRLANLQAATDAIAGIGIEVLRSSSVYDTDPVGPIKDQASFLNACLLVRTELEPLELLEALKALEHELGRSADAPRYGPRPIDLDILLLGSLKLASERLALPHEQLLSRRFVLVPALELDMELTTPEGERLADALLRLPLDEGVRWAGPPLALADSEGAAGPAGLRVER
jgi:2-amino-4-hydroxy-6-hydroxymethyldihydropteridine diphosphokinase